MCPYHELFPLPLCPSMAEMEGRVDSCVTGRPGQSGERLSSGQSVAAWAQQRPRGGSPRRRLSVEAVAAEGEAWLWAVLSWKRQARAEHCQQPDSWTDSSTTQHGGGELSKNLPQTHTAYKLSSGVRTQMKKISAATDGSFFLTCSFFRPSAALQTCFPSFGVSCTRRVCRHSLAYAFICLPLTASPPLSDPPSILPAPPLHPSLPHSPLLHLQLPFSVVQKKLSPHLLFTRQSAFPPKKILFSHVSLNYKLVKSITFTLEREKVKVCHWTPLEVCRFYPDFFERISQPYFTYIGACSFKL